MQKLNRLSIVQEIFTPDWLPMLLSTLIRPHLETTTRACWIIRKKAKNTTVGAERVAANWALDLNILAYNIKLRGLDPFDMGHK